MPEIGNTESIENTINIGNFQPMDEKEVKKEAEKIKKERELPVKPGNVVDFETGMKWFKLLNDKQWNRITPYLYRLFPIIDREPKYIDVFAGMFTLQEIISKHGGGKYKLVVNDIETRKGAEGYFEITFEIPISQYAPILNFEDLDLTAPRNRQFIDRLKLDGILDRDGRKITKQESVSNNGNGEANTMMMSMFKDMLGKFMDLNKDQQLNVRNSLKTDDSAIAKALELVQKSGETGIQMVLERAKQEDPTKMLTLMMTMMEKMKPSLPPTDNSKDQLFMMMITMMQDNSKNQIAMMQNMNSQMLAIMESKKGDGDGEDGLGMIDKVLTIADRLGFKKGNPVSEPPSWIDKAVDMVPGVIQGLAGILGPIMMNRNNPNIQTMNRVPNNVPSNVNHPIENQQVVEVPSGYLGRGYNPTPDPITNIPSNTIPQTISSTQSQGQSTINNMPVTNNQEQELAFYTNFLYNSLIQDIPGYGFAQSVVNMVGRDKYLEIITMGEDNIFNTIKNNQVSWTRLHIFGEEKVKKFIHEFVNADKIIEEMENEEE